MPPRDRQKDCTKRLPYSLLKRFLGKIRDIAQTCCSETLLREISQTDLREDIAGRACLEMSWTNDFEDLRPTHNSRRLAFATSHLEFSCCSGAAGLTTAYKCTILARILHVEAKLPKPMLLLAGRGGHSAWIARVNVQKLNRNMPKCGAKPVCVTLPPIVEADRRVLEAYFPFGKGPCPLPCLSEIRIPAFWHEAIPRHPNGRSRLRGRQFHGHGLRQVLRVASAGRRHRQRATQGEVAAAVQQHGLTALLSGI